MVRSSKLCPEIFSRLIVSQVIDFWRFYGSEKLFFTTNLLLKWERQKITKNLPSVLKKIISHLVKFLQDYIELWRAAALIVSTGHIFIKKFFR